jgi:restriction endonuclease Mrr
MQEMNGGGDRHEILARALSIGSFTQRELEAPPPKGSARKYSRMIDHDLSWALTDLKRDGLATNPAKGLWLLTEHGVRQAEAPLADTATPKRLAELRTMPYDEYLRTPEWRQIRAAALVRADHRCALDPNHPGRLEVHHRYYERRGAELPSDLIVLCGDCHRRHHLKSH